MPDGSSSVVSARPSILIDGQDNPDLAAGMLSLSIAENLAGLYRCEIQFGNWGVVGGATGFRYFDRTILEFGKGLQVRLGDAVLFDGRITALEGRFPEDAPPQIGVLVEDRLQDLRMTRRTRSFDSLSDDDLFRQIASDHGLQSQTSLAGGAHQQLAQVNQSDLALLRDRARATGCEVWIEGSTLHAAPRSARGSGGQPPRLSLGARLREFSVLADLAGQRTGVTVGGWDVSGKAVLTADADDAVISSELSGGVSGASTLSSAFGARKETIAHCVPLTSAEAHAQAEAAFRLLARRFVRGRGRAQTDASLRVGASVDLGGLGPLFSGQYYLSEVRHLYDGAKGLRTEFTAERPWLGTP